MDRNNPPRHMIEMEIARRARMSPSEVADEITKLVGILLPTEKPRAEDRAKYASAWVDAGYMIVQHGPMIVDALRQIAMQPNDAKTAGSEK